MSMCPPPAGLACSSTTPGWFAPSAKVKSRPSSRGASSASVALPVKVTRWAVGCWGVWSDIELDDRRWAIGTRDKGRGSLRFTFYVLRFTFYVLRFTFYVLRFTFYVLRFTFYVLRIVHRPSSIVYLNTFLP